MPLYEFEKYRRRSKNPSRRGRWIPPGRRGWGKHFGKVIVLVLLVVALSVALLSTQPGSTVVGTASVIDGDSLEIRGKRIRLFGIDAPEGMQSCTKNGVPYACGRDAASALSQQIGPRIVECRQKDVDRYQRIVAVCSADGIDLNGWMVAEGHARAYLKHSFRYVWDEIKARWGGKGLWAGEFDNPWDYRHNR